jgi:hypothetical protein
MRKIFLISDALDEKNETMRILQTARIQFIAFSTVSADSNASPLKTGDDDIKSPGIFIGNRNEFF